MDSSKDVSPQGDPGLDYPGQAGYSGPPLYHGWSDCPSGFPGLAGTPHRKRLGSWAEKHPRNRKKKKSR
jgi:hypothetical protein